MFLVSPKKSHKSETKDSMEVYFVNRKIQALPLFALQNYMNGFKGIQDFVKEGVGLHQRIWMRGFLAT